MPSEEAGQTSIVDQAKSAMTDALQTSRSRLYILGDLKYGQDLSQSTRQSTGETSEAEVEESDEEPVLSVDASGEKLSSDGSAMFDDVQARPTRKSTLADEKSDNITRGPVGGMTASSSGDAAPTMTDKPDKLAERSEQVPPDLTANTPTSKDDKPNNLRSKLWSWVRGS